MAEETNQEETRPVAADNPAHEEQTDVAAGAVNEEKEAALDVAEEEIPPAMDEVVESEVSYVDGPAVFMRTQEGRRRNPRHVGREVKLEDIDYKRVQVLSRFVDARGRIFSRRKTRVSAKMQRRVTKAIKRARHLALMPYTGEHVRITRKGGK